MKQHEIKALVPSHIEVDLCNNRLVLTYGDRAVVALLTRTVNAMSPQQFATAILKPAIWQLDSR